MKYRNLNMKYRKILGSKQKLKLRRAKYNTGKTRGVKQKHDTRNKKQKTYQRLTQENARRHWNRLREVTQADDDEETQGGNTDELTETSGSTQTKYTQGLLDKHDTG